MICSKHYIIIIQILQKVSVSYIPTYTYIFLASPMYNIRWACKYYNIQLIRLQLLYDQDSQCTYAFLVFAGQIKTKRYTMIKICIIFHIYIYDKRQKKKHKNILYFAILYIDLFIFLLITMNSCSDAGNFQPTLISCEKIECSCIYVKCHRGFLYIMYMLNVFRGRTWRLQEQNNNQRTIIVNVHLYGIQIIEIGSQDLYAENYFSNQ